MGKEGYESASMGVWATVCTLQAVMGLLCLFVYGDLSSYGKDVDLDEIPHQLKYVTSATFGALGAASLASAAATLICAVVGYFVLPGLCNLLMALAGLFSMAVSLAVAIIIGKTVTAERRVIDDLVQSGQQPLFLWYGEDYTVALVHEWKVLFIVLGALAIITLVLAARALELSARARALDAVVYTGGLVLAAAVGGLITMNYADVGSSSALGILWLVGATLLFILLQQQKVLWPRVTSIALALVSALHALLSVVTLSIFCKKFVANGRYHQQEIFSCLTPEMCPEGEVLATAKKENESTVAFFAAILSTAAALTFIMSTLASFRAVLGPSPAEKEMAQDSAEEAVEGRNEA